MIAWPQDRSALSREQTAQIVARVHGRVAAWAAPRGLSAVYSTDRLERLFVPLAGYLAARPASARAPLVIGVAGAQGTGKSTLAALLEILFADGLGLRCATLSLDDLYLTRAEREQLARAVHPLLRTRGVPGTHDVALGTRVIAALRSAVPGQRVRVPRFDKADDDRVPSAQWPEVEAPIDCLIFEGWCVGARPEPDAALGAPINALEREHDPDGRWRRYVNARLAGPYRASFEALDVLLFLAAPDIQHSLAWRIEQEHALATRAPIGRAVMTDEEVARFVQHYERISRHMLLDAPGRADVVLRLGRDHDFASLDVR